MAAAEVLAGAVAAALLGRSLLPRGRPWSPAALAEDFFLGLALTVPAALVWGLAGLPWTPVLLPAISLAAAVALSLSRRRRPVAASVHPASQARAVDRAAEVLVVLGVALVAWKWARSAIWSWDHFAIWGVKARRLVVDGGLDLAFLQLTQYLPANPQYPLGLPLAWRFLSPSEPSMSAFRLCHALFAAGLLAAIHGAARRLGASRALAAVLAAAVCASPLFWDTEAVGLAELPLAAFAAAGVLLALEARDDARFPAWPAGVLFGFLAWLKMEGLPLGLFLTVAAAMLAATRWRGLFMCWLITVAPALAIGRFLLPKGVPFLEGAWIDRLSSRIGSPGAILLAMLRELRGPEWLGLWFLFAAAALGALVLRVRAARAFSAVIAAQLLVYAFVYFGTFMDPTSHVETSFHRLAAALLPLAALTIAALSLSKPKTAA